MCVSVFLTFLLALPLFPFIACAVCVCVCAAYTCSEIIVFTVGFFSPLNSYDVCVPLSCIPFPLVHIVLLLFCLRMEFMCTVRVQYCTYVDSILNGESVAMCRCDRKTSSQHPPNE